MTGFKQFKVAVKSKGGIWASRDVYYSQTRDTYAAHYAPTYPDKSPLEQTLVYNHTTHMWLRYNDVAHPCRATERSKNDE